MFVSLPCPHPLRSMRDVAGEKEAVRVKLEEKQEQLQSCEQKLAAAETDKRSKSDELQAMTRDYKQHWCVCVCVCVCACAHTVTCSLSWAQYENSRPTTKFVRL